MFRFTMALAAVAIVSATASADYPSAFGARLQCAAEALCGAADEFEPEGENPGDIANLISWLRSGYVQYVKTSSAFESITARGDLARAGYAGRIHTVNVRVKAGFQRYTNYYVLYLPR